MEEIKIRRYKIRNDFCMCGKPKGFIGDITKGEWVKYSDHKAVLEKMQNKIDELEKENKSLKGANETMNIIINNMEDLGV